MTARKQNPPSPGKPVVLVGLMGAGKSKIGRMLAEATGTGFVDNDAEVEKAARLTIPEIFASYGEEKFRSLEADVLKRVLGENHGIIAVGGGAFMHDKSRALILEKAIAVWLRARARTLARRISDPSTRPLLAEGDPVKVLTGLAAERDAIYGLAHITVDTDGLSHAATLGKVRAALDGYGLK